MPMPRSLELLETDRTLQRVAVRLHEEIDAPRFSGTKPLASISLIHPTALAHSDYAIRITTPSLSSVLHIRNVVQIIFDRNLALF